MKTPASNGSVLIITERFYPEEFGINELAIAWKDRGYQVAVLTQIPSYPFDKVYEGYKNKLFQIQIWNDIKIYRVFSLLGYNKNVVLKILNYLVFAFFASVVSLFIGKKYGAVFVYQIGPLTQAAPGVLIKKIFKKKLYLWVLDIWPDTVFAFGLKQRRLTVFLVSSFTKMVYRNCKTIFISCRGFENKIKDLAPKALLQFSPQWAPEKMRFENIQPHPALKNNFNFTFAGNIGKLQNLENVIRGFGYFAENLENVRLNIIGDGSYLNHLKSTVADAKIPSVVFWGRKSLVEMPSWLAGSDVLIISLINEPVFALTVPAKFQAYLTVGKPIYCIMKGEVADLVNSNKLGLVVSSPDDVFAIKQGFEEFYHTSKELMAEFEFNARDLYSSSYNSDEIINQKTKKMFEV